MADGDRTIRRRHCIVHLENASIFKAASREELHIVRGKVQVIRYKVVRGLCLKFLIRIKRQPHQFSNLISDWSKLKPR